MSGTASTDLKAIDHGIVDELANGRNSPANLADRLDVTRQYIHQRLQLLAAGDHVENIGRGVYELVDDPRDADVEHDEIASRLDGLKDTEEIEQ